MKTTLVLALLPLFSCAAVQKTAIGSLAHATANQKYQVNHTEAEWKKLLPEESFNVLRHAGTEKAFDNKYWDNHSKGVYECAGCGQVLFDSATKFESGTGWPSFFKEIAKGRTLIKSDHSLGMERDEVLCARCGGHLGHVFDDGPNPTGLRFCMNSAAMKFVKKA